MFEFIVSGHVPGTHLQITFNWVVILVPLLVATSQFYYAIRRHAKTMTPTKQISDIAI